MWFRGSCRSLRHQARFRPAVEWLETRTVPYSTTGNSWLHPELISLSFAPDGTDLLTWADGERQYSDLIGDFNGTWPTSAWQYQFLKAAQVWAQQTNINFRVATDNGAALDSGLYQQGSADFGDIRFTGYNPSVTSWYGRADYPQPINNTSWSGEEFYNTTVVWRIPGYAPVSGTDVFTVAAHEIGHSLGLGHTTVSSSAIMWQYYTGTKSVLHSDDIAGIRAIYSGGSARSADANDAVASNGSFATATPIILDGNGVALLTNVDITTVADNDYYIVTAPSNTTGTLQVKMQSSGLSLLAPWVAVYNSSQQLLQSANGVGNYGHTLTLTITGVSAGQSFYIKGDGADTTAFGTGKYALAVNFGSGQTPTASSPNTQTLNGDPPSYGGGPDLKSQPRNNDHDDHEHTDDGPGDEVLFADNHEEHVTPTADRFIVVSSASAALQSPIVVHSQAQLSGSVASQFVAAPAVVTRTSVPSGPLGDSGEEEKGADGWLDEDLLFWLWQEETESEAAPMPSKDQQPETPADQAPSAIDRVFAEVEESAFPEGEDDVSNEMIGMFTAEYGIDPAWALAGGFAGACATGAMNPRDRRRHRLSL